MTSGYQLEMITFNIIAHDCTLFPTRARYKGCICFSGQCERIEASDVTLPEKVKRPKIEALVMKISIMNDAMSQNQIHTAMLFGVKEQLDKQGLCLNTIRTNIVELAPDLDQIILRCPKIPTDTDAWIGVRNDPKNSDRKQKIFGYTMVLSKPIIDYNARREILTAKAFRERGYDRNCWPYAPCGMPTRTNGFDAAHQRLTFCCMKLKAPGIRILDKTYDIKAYEHLKKNLRLYRPFVYSLASPAVE